MDSLLVSAADLATGSGVAALYSAADPEVGFGWVFGGAGLGLLWSYMSASSHPVPYLPSLVRLVLSAAQFFAMWEAKDSDVGAGLVVIPVFFLACCTPLGSATEYLHRASLASAALNAAALVAGGAYYGLNPEAYAWESAYAPGVRKFISITNVAFAVQAGPSLWASAARAAVFAVFFGLPHLARGLLHGPTPDWFLALYAAVLVQSTQCHATQLRIELATATADPQRVLMFLVACALAVGYVERMGDPVNLSWLVLAAVVAGLLTWGLRKKWLERLE